jgi:hypothetical protein
MLEHTENMRASRYILYTAASQPLCSSPGSFYVFLPGQLLPLLRPPEEEFPVLFVISMSRVPLALASVL